MSSLTDRCATKTIETDDEPKTHQPEKPLTKDVTGPPMLSSGIDDLVERLSGVHIEQRPVMVDIEALLVGENPVDILLVGESRTRALAIALAVMRGSLNGIWATSYDTPTSWSYDHFEHVEVVLARKRAVENAGGVLFTNKVSSPMNPPHTR